jgi:phage portal protein BeeE
LQNMRPTYSNISMTSKFPTKVRAVASAVNLTADAVGTLPVKLHMRDGKGKDAIPAHPAFTLASEEANNWSSAFKRRAKTP